MRGVIQLVDYVLGEHNPQTKTVLKWGGGGGGGGSKI